jgi:hypothetical protein
MPTDTNLDNSDALPSQDTESTDTQSLTKPGDPLEGQEELQKVLYSLYLKCVSEDRYPRLVEVKDVKQAEFYWGGRQYVWWSSQDKTWQLPSQAQAVNYGDLNLDDMPRFEFVTNIYQARGLMVIGAVAGAPPRVRFFPADADNPADLETADGRTKLARLIQRWNPPQKMLQDEVYHAWTGGFIAYWTRYVGDAEKFGVDSLDLINEGSEESPDTILCPNCGWTAPADEAVPPVPCPECGHELTANDIVSSEPIPLPEDGGTIDAPRGRQVITVYGALNCKRPQHVQDQSEYHYFAIEREVHYSTLRAAFDEKADEIKPGMAFGADDSFERNARLSVAENTKLLTQTGSAQAALCTYAVVWFRPSAFWMIDNKDQRAKLLELFPRGCRVELSGSTYLKSEPQSMDDCIVTCHAMPGRGQHRPAIGTSMLSIQDRINTFSNIEAETYEYGIPITYRASDTFASEANEDQRAAPGLEIEVALQPGQQIQNRIMQVRADAASPSMQAHEDKLMGPVSDEISGAYPALSGASTPGSTPDTLGQQAMQRDQAMGRMGVFYVNLKQAHADILTLACRDLEQNVTGILKSPVLGDSGDFESDAIDITAMDGEAEAYPEGDENFPELWNQQRATMMQMMDSPYGPQLIKEDGNAELFGKLTGIPDLKIPGTAGRRKALKAINEIVKALTPTDNNPLGGATNVEPDDSDFHDIEAATCKDWLNCAKGQKVKQENPLAWQAVKGYMNAQLTMIPKPPPPTKPLSETFTTNFKDLPPQAQIQALAQVGIHIDADAFVEQVIMERAKKPAPKPPQPPNGETGPKQ